MGVNHGFMPIRVDVVSKAEFAKWAAAAKIEYAAIEVAPKTESGNLATSKKLANTAKAIKLVQAAAHAPALVNMKGE